MAMAAVVLALLASFSVVSSSSSHMTMRGGSARLVLAVDAVGDYESELTAECEARGGRLVSVWSSEFLTRELETNTKLDDAERADLQRNCVPEQDNDLLEWARSRFGDPSHIAGVVCVSDQGLVTSERLAHALSVSANGILPARRDKLEMAARVRAAGLDSIRQCLAFEWPAARAFLRTLPAGASCVLKPRRGCASVGVYRANSIAEAHAAFVTLLGMPVSLDASVDVAEGVLVQEFLGGTEFAVDTVSRRGEHRVVHLWRYDKRQHNGAHFVYFGTRLCDGRSAEEEAVMAYACRVLDALALCDGPAHIEVKHSPERGPVLVEANVGRWHGVPYSAMLGNLAQGYNGFGVAMAALLDEAAWREVPPRPVLLAHALMVHLVVGARGRVKAVRLPQPGDAAFPSLVEAESKFAEGELVARPSTDLKSDAGHLLLVSRQADTLEADYARILAAQAGGAFFEIEPESETASAPASDKPYDVSSCVRAVLALGVSASNEVERADLLALPESAT